MEAGHAREMLALLVVVAASLAGVVYAFLRIAGVGHDWRRNGRPPPRTPLG